MHSEAFQEQLIYYFNIKAKSSFDIKSRLLKTISSSDELSIQSDWQNCFPALTQWS